MLRILRRGYVRSSFIVFPEIPEETAASKLFASERKFPILSNVVPEGLYAACMRQAAEYDVEVSKHSDTLVDAKTPKTFDAVFAPLEKLNENLSENLNTARLLAVLNTNDKKFMKTYRYASNAVESARNDRWAKPGLYNAVNQLRGDRVSSDAGDGNATQARFEAAVVRMYMGNAERSGARLSASGLRKFRSLMLHLTTNQKAFARRVEYTEAKFLHLMKASNVEEMPTAIRCAVFGPEAETGAGPWQMRLSDLTYEAVMCYCSDRATRWNIFHAYTNRAARGVHVDLAEQNEKHVHDIRETRHDIGALLGTHFCDLVLRERACRSLGTLKDFLLAASEKHIPQAESDLTKLSEFAALPSLDRWDLAYFRRRFIERQFKNTSAPLFDFAATRDRLFRYAETLLGVRVVDATSKLPQDAVPHKDVRYYEVHDAEGSKQTPLGAFYLDARPRIATLTLPIRYGNAKTSRLPISYLRVGTAVEGGEQKLHFAGFLSLATELANVLETLVQNCPFGELQAVQANINMDAFPILPRLLLRQLLTDSASSARLLGLDADAASAVRDMSEAYRSFRAIDVALNVYRAALELELHVTQKPHEEVRGELWPRFVPFFKLHRFDNSLMSATDIFCEEESLRQYTSLFANMLAANIFEVCREELSSNNDADRARVGRKIRKLLIEPRCALHYGNVFDQLACFDAKLKSLNFDVDLTYF